MPGRVFRIGTRRSPLALRQVEEVLGFLREFYPALKAQVIGIDTLGDKDKITPISEIEGTDFFTHEIEEALLRGERSPTIDFAVHSAKDLPDEIPTGLCIAAITKSIDSYDALVSKNSLAIKELPQGARIGTSSPRRKEQLKAWRQDFQIVDIRGNIEERLSLLDPESSLAAPACRQAGAYWPSRLDAIVIAACALVRLGLGHRITQRIPFEILKPHPLQGSLAIEARNTDAELIEFLSKIDTREKILA